MTSFPAGVFDLFPDDGNQDEEGAGKNQGDSDFEDGVGDTQNKAEGEEGGIGAHDENAGPPEDETEGVGGFHGGCYLRTSRVSGYCAYQPNQNAR